MMFLSGGREDGQAHDFYFSQQGTGGANTQTFDNSYNYGAIASGLNRQHRYTFRLDYENDITVARKVTRGFSLFVDDSEEPQKDDGTQSTVFPMENAAITGAPPAYLDGLNFWLQMQNTTNASVTVDSLRLVELSRIEDVTDDALAQLTMEMLTDTPDDVSGALKPLPTTLCGAEISWSSNYPDIISHDGQKIVKPLLGDKVVTLTATHGRQTALKRPIFCFRPVLRPKKSASAMWLLKTVRIIFMRFCKRVCMLNLTTSARSIISAVR